MGTQQGTMEDINVDGAMTTTTGRYFLLNKVLWVICTTTYVLHICVHIYIIHIVKEGE